jgi:hyperosmotically inducible protein
MQLSKSTPWILSIALAAFAPSFAACHSNQSVGGQLTDATITASVKSKLISDDEVKARNIDVNTDHGVVYLIGRVDSQAEKSEAERTALGCEGVMNVVNNLTVEN